MLEGAPSKVRWLPARASGSPLQESLTSLAKGAIESTNEVGGDLAAAAKGVVRGTVQGAQEVGRRYAGGRPEHHW